MAQIIYAAFGDSFAGAMTDIHGKPMGAWRDALKAANDLQAASLAPWRDIASAPLDGTVIGLSRDGERLLDFSWSVEQQRWEKKVGYPTRTIVLTTAPTHWMPVPPPPLTGTAKAA
ncbi:hypothetical protein AB6806_28550 [Bosea sp. RCC_152_1]|uniref:hypothetical protein n=1 Tax=Bosea sp. RCC_152_1 TaxID=3239228 RepID=UPI003525755F